MITLGNSILLAGFARENQSVLRFIQKRYPDINIAITDQNPDVLKNLDKYPTFSGPTYLDHLANFDSIIRSPGLPKQLLKDAKYVTTAINLFFDLCPGVTIGVTGTKGKSTTSSLIHHILKTSGQNTIFAGNIGTPALDYLDQIKPDTKVVLELSSYQLDDIDYSPHLAVILPISEEHLSYHGSFDAYVKAKSHIVSHQTSEDHVIFYSQNEYANSIAQSSPAKKHPYDQSLEFLKPLIDTNQFPLQGKANQENALAAITACQILGLPDNQILKAIPSFKPLEHRLELVGTYSGITFYNDSLSTTPVSTLHALEALGDQVATLIAGGFDRGLDMTPLGPALAQSNLQTLILFPDTGNRIKEALLKADSQSTIQIFEVHNMQEAVDLSFKHTPQSKICLLSPAAASFNLFKDYAARGTQFKHLIQSHVTT